MYLHVKPLPADTVWKAMRMARIGTHCGITATAEKPSTLWTEGGQWRHDVHLAGDMTRIVRRHGANPGEHGLN